MKTLLLTVGLPQSGKSTWANRQGFPIINRDSIRLAIGGTIRYFKEEDRVTELERIMAMALFSAGHEKVIVDATHLKMKYVEGWEKWMDDNFDKVRVFLIPFTTSLEECVDRAIKNFGEDTHFPAVIRNMWKGAEISFKIPETKLEGMSNEDNDGQRKA